MEPKKRKKKVTPMQRTLALLRERGWTCGIVEHWNPFVGIRQDLYGWCDLLCLGEYDEKPSIIGVQVAGPGSDHAKHLRKMLDEPRFHEFKRCGGVALLISWRTLKALNKDGKKGKRDVWEPRIERP